MLSSLRENSVSLSRVRGFKGGGEVEVVKWEAGGENLVVTRCEEGWEYRSARNK
jgi:hypothetical protein